MPDAQVLDVARVRPVLAALHLGEAIAVAPMAGGSSPSFRIDLADGSAVVLKTYARHVTELPANEVAAARLLEGIDVPTTRYLALDGSRERLPFDFAITNYLPGSTVATFRDEPDVADLHRQMGAVLRKLHSIRVAGYGHFEGDGVRGNVTTHTEWIDRMIADAFRQFRRHGGDEDLARRLEAVLQARLAVLEHGSGPVFAHNDLNPNNVLAVRDADGRLRLTGVIDVGSAIASDALCDLAKTLFICEHEAPGSGPAIREGYGPIEHPDPEGAIWLYTLLHRVVMWWWLRMVGAIKDGEPSGLIDDLWGMVREAG